MRGQSKYFEDSEIVPLDLVPATELLAAGKTLLRCVCGVMVCGRHLTAMNSHRGRSLGRAGAASPSPASGPVALLVLIVQDGTIQTLSSRHVALIDAILVFRKF